MSLDKVTLSRTSEDGLRQTHWQFFQYSSSLYVDVYEELERPSVRHKFKSVRRWSRLGNPRENKIRREEVPLTTDIEKEAVEAFAAQLKAKLIVRFQD